MVLSHGWPDDIAKRDGGAILNHHRTVHGIGCGWNESIERQPLAFSGTDSLDLKLLEWKYQFFHYRILTLIFLRNFILPLSAWTSTDSHQILNKQKSPWVSSPTKLKTPPPRRLTLEEDTPPWSNSVPSACTRRSPPAAAVPKLLRGDMYIGVGKFLLQHNNMMILFGFGEHQQQIALTIY